MGHNINIKYNKNKKVKQQSKLHLLDDQKVAGEPDFDGGTGELKLLSKTSKGIQGP